MLLGDSLGFGCWSRTCHSQCQCQCRKSVGEKSKSLRHLHPSALNQIPRCTVHVSSSRRNIFGPSLRPPTMMMRRASERYHHPHILQSRHAGRLRKVQLRLALALGRIFLCPMLARMGEEHSSPAGELDERGSNGGGAHLTGLSGADTSSSEDDSHHH